LKAGAAGVLLKDLHELDLIRALQVVLSGRTFIDERVGGEGLARMRRIQADSTVLHEALTPREYDVLRLVAQGMTSKDIADRLGLATNTVRGYTQSLITKLGARNRIQALTTARKLRLI
jgi:DNA-binding NarL/FixJ family response regulator